MVHSDSTAALSSVENNYYNNLSPKCAYTWVILCCKRGLQVFSAAHASIEGYERADNLVNDVAISPASPCFLFPSFQSASSDSHNTVTREVTSRAVRPWSKIHVPGRRRFLFGFIPILVSYIFSSSIFICFVIVSFHKSLWLHLASTFAVSLCTFLGNEYLAPDAARLLHLCCQVSCCWIGCVTLGSVYGNDNSIRV